MAAFACAVAPTGAEADRTGLRATVTRADCAAATTFQSAPDVTYEPGRDVYGRPIVGADLNPLPPGTLPETLTLYLGADLAGELGILPFLDDPDADLSIGEVAVQDGRVFLNGRPLFDADAAFLQALCAAAVAPD